MVAVLSPREKRVFGSGVNDSEPWSETAASNSARIAIRAKTQNLFTLPAANIRIDL